MKILLIGDIIGNIGVKKVKEVLPNLKKDEGIDFIIANAENSADGMGITANIYKDLVGLGINVLTMGNHTWGKKDIFNIIENKNLLRPANYSEGILGNGYGIYECNGKKIAVIDLIGRAEMGVLSDNPFAIADKLINKIKKESDIILVEFHAEATAEKIAMSYFLDGRVNVVYGTHTHVQTADEKISEKGMAYITDLGMTGPKKSVIGMEVEASIKRFLTSIPERYKVSDDKNCSFEGCIVEINDENCRTERIYRIKL